MEPYTLSALATIFSSLLAFWLAYNTGMVRAKHKAPPYEHTENKDVWISCRAHMNTIEMMVVYLPLLWVATIFGPSTIAGIVGLVWFASRVWYAQGYLKNPKQRQAPFMIGLACIGITALLGFYGLIF